MASLNKVFLIGNLTREPELRYTPGSNYAVCEFGIAINRRFTQGDGQMKDETCFIEIVVWGKQAESSARFLQKGASVFIEGRLAYDQWTERETQKKRSRIRVTADRVQFLSTRSADGVPADVVMPDEDPTQQGYAAPRQQMQYGAPQQRPAQPRQPYARQQYDTPPQQVYRSQPQQGMNHAPVNAAPPEPEMPEEDPFENVESRKWESK